MLDPRLVAQLHCQAKAARWCVEPDVFARTLEASVTKAFAGQSPDADTVRRYLAALHLEDLALACACAAGLDEAWQHFVLTYRPALYRAADALGPGGGARDLADSLYADLFGLADAGQRRSLLTYFHGRSSLTTWLRAVLAQRHVDRLRAHRRTVALPDDESAGVLVAPGAGPDPERNRFLSLMRAALAYALARLMPKDRLRLACYYAQRMTLAQVGRLLGEHEATVSRQIAAARKALRVSMEHHLRNEAHLGTSEVEECFRCVAEDAGDLDLGELLGAQSGGLETRKESALERSEGGAV